MNEEIKGLIKGTRGKFFSVDFTKRDGSERHMTCRTGVSKHVTGEGLKFNPEEKGLIGVFDTVAKGYRFINAATVKKFQCGKQTWGK